VKDAAAAGSAAEDRKGQGTQEFAGDAPSAQAASVSGKGGRIERTRPSEAQRSAVGFSFEMRKRHLDLRIKPLLAREGKKVCETNHGRTVFES